MQNLYWISARRIRLNHGWNWGYGVFQTMPDLPELSLMQIDDGKYSQERPDLTKLLGKRSGEPFYHETEYNTLIGRNFSNIQFLVCGMQFLFKSIEFVTTLLLFYDLVFWFSGIKVCEILAPWPGIKPALPVLEGEFYLCLTNYCKLGGFKQHHLLSCSLYIRDLGMVGPGFLLRVKALIKVSIKCLKRFT